MKAKITLMKAGKILQFILVITIIAGLVSCDGNKSKAKKADKDKNTESTAKQANKQEPELVYDSKGNITERHAYSYRKADGSVRSFDSYYYTYDDRGNVVKEVKESYKPDGTLSYKNINYYTWNDDNLQVELVFESYNAEDELQRKARHTYKYNERGHKIEDLGYFDDGSISSKIVLDPDEKGALRSEEFIHYNEDGSKKDHKKYYYTEYGLDRTVDLMEQKDK
ncbi:MAG: hypothetical protein KDC09_08165 [Bacteroidales bacterium]|nr:hypothetical protein [Bacteroidales bacterium]